MATVADHASHNHVSIKTYLLVFAALMVLLVLTVVAAFLPIENSALALGLALLIATVKMLLVILYFMHVIYNSMLTKVFVFASFFWFLILIGLTYSDYLSRDWLSMSRGWNENPARTAPEPVTTPASGARH